MGPKPYSEVFIDVEFVDQKTLRVAFLKRSGSEYAGHIEMLVGDERSYDLVLDAALTTVSRMVNRCIHEIHFFVYGGKWMHSLRQSGYWHCSHLCEFCDVHRLRKALWVKDLAPMKCPASSSTDQIQRLKEYHAWFETIPCDEIDGPDRCCLEC